MSHYLNLRRLFHKKSHPVGCLSSRTCFDVGTENVYQRSVGAPFVGICFLVLAVIVDTSIVLILLSWV